MDTKDTLQPVVTAAALAAGPEHPFFHPLNPNSEIHFRGVDGKSMSELAGLQRVSVYTARIPPGRESFAFHAHRHEEEFLFVLSGRGVAGLAGGDGGVQAVSVAQRSACAGARAGSKAAIASREASSSLAPANPSKSARCAASENTSRRVS